MTNPIETASRATKAKIVFERTYRASVRELWDMWTTKEGFESWWAPEGLLRGSPDDGSAAGGAVRVRHDWRYAGNDCGAREVRPAAFPSGPRPLLRIPPARVAALTQMMDFVPGVAPYETTMRVEFVPAGEDVRMVLTVDTTTHSEEWTRLSKEGFESQLGKLAKRFGQ